MILKTNNFFFFKFFILNNFNYYILNNTFYSIYYFYKIYKFLKYLFVFKKFYIYSYNYSNCILFKFIIKIFIDVFIKLLYVYLSFTHYKFFIKIGLGFRKKYLYFNDFFIMYAGGRHWLLFCTSNDFYFNIRKRSILLFTSSLNNYNYYSLITKYIRKESIFKTKGFMFKRIRIKKKIPRSIIFARRIKYYKLKLKLSKKQKLA